jgi:Lrp/AsnC family transcriptional regulator, leucine-responsive regulatory protein
MIMPELLGNPGPDWAGMGKGMAFDLDRLDIQLLNVVQANNQLTAVDLSEKIPLSPSAALRRLNRLRQSGVIARESAVLSEDLVKSRVSGIVLVQLNQHAPEVVQALKRQLADKPQVQLMFEISGAFDLLLLIVERDLASFVAFTDHALAISSYVHRFETSFVKNRIKASLAVHLDGHDASR